MSSKHSNAGSALRKSLSLTLFSRFSLIPGLILLFISTALLAWPSSIKYQVRYDEAQVIAVAFSDGGERIITGHADGTVSIRDAATGSEQRKIRAHDGRVYQLAAQTNGDLFATGKLGRDTIKLWNAGTGEQVASVGTYDEAFGLAFSPDGEYLISSGSSNGFTTLDLWSLSSESKVRTLGKFPVNRFVPGSIHFSADSKRIFVSAQNSMHGIHIWSVNGNKLRNIPYNDDLISMSIHKSDTIAVAGTFKSKVVVFDLNSGRVLRTMTGHNKHVTTVAAVDENHAISASYGRDDTGPFILWDLRNGRKVHTIDEKISSVNQIAVNPKNGDVAIVVNTFGNLGNPTTLIVYGD